MEAPKNPEQQKLGGTSRDLSSMGLSSSAIKQEDAARLTSHWEVDHQDPQAQRPLNIKALSVNSSDHEVSR